MSTYKSKLQQCRQSAKAREMVFRRMPGLKIMGVNAWELACRKTGENKAIFADVPAAYRAVKKGALDNINES